MVISPREPRLRRSVLGPAELGIQVVEGADACRIRSRGSQAAPDVRSCLTRGSMSPAPGLPVQRRHRRLVALHPRVEAGQVLRMFLGIRF
jgi:hypothetical protein